MTFSRHFNQCIIVIYPSKCLQQTPQCLGQELQKSQQAEEEVAPASFLVPHGSHPSVSSTCTITGQCHMTISLASKDHNSYKQEQQIPGLSQTLTPCETIPHVALTMVIVITNRKNIFSSWNFKNTELSGAIKKCQNSEVFLLIFFHVKTPKYFS